MRKMEISNYILMFKNFLTYSLLGDEVWKYLLLIIFLFLGIIVGKIIKYIIQNHFTKLAAKTKIEIDDIIIRSLIPSISMLVFAIFFYFGEINFVGTLKEALDKTFKFLIIIPFVYFMIKFSTEILGFYIKKAQSKGKKVNEAGIDLLMTIIRFSLYLVGILLILDNLGYNVSTLIAGLGVGGLAFALAAQDILKNFFAGISLIFDKTFNKKEIIKFGNITGIIEEVGLRTTKIRSYDKSLYTVPNSKLAEDIVENISKADKVKIKQTFGLTYDTPVKKLKKAKEIIEKAILEEKDTDKENYWIWFDEFGDFSLNIKVIYYGLLKPDDWPEKVLFKERINFKIKEEFEKAGIEMAFPTQTIELKK
jgi:MscS family membrane protein